MTGIRLLASTVPLTAAEPASIEQMRRRTFCGQASWAEGPQRCSMCVYWDDVGRGRSKSTRERACHKFRQLTGRTGPRVPANALACRFFSPLNKDQRR
jgi:hypothetical protein